MKDKIRTSVRLYKQRPVLGKWKSWFIVTMGIIGFLLTATEITTIINEKFSLAPSYVLVILVASMILSYLYIVFRQYFMLNETFEWKNGFSITINVGDYFETLDKFPTGVAVSGMSADIDTESTKENSIYYGMFKKYVENKEVIQDFEKSKESYYSKFDDLIRSGLIEEECHLGDVSKVTYQLHRNRLASHILFIANSRKEISSSEFKGDNKTLSYLDSLWKRLGSENIYPTYLVMPMLGTGHSKDNSEMSAAISIVDSFFNYAYTSEIGKNNGVPIVKKLVLSIPSAFIIEEKINLSDLYDYIEMKNNLLDVLYINKGLYKKINEVIE